jgi:hypothetical protein
MNGSVKSATRLDRISVREGVRTETRIGFKNLEKIANQLEPLNEYGGGFMLLGGTFILDRNRDSFDQIVLLKGFRQDQGLGFATETFGGEDFGQNGIMAIGGEWRPGL